MTQNATNGVDSHLKINVNTIVGLSCYFFTGPVFKVWNETCPKEQHSQRKQSEIDITFSGLDTLFFFSNYFDS